MYIFDIRLQNGLGIWVDLVTGAQYTAFLLGRQSVRSHLDSFLSVATQP